MSRKLKEAEPMGKSRERHPLSELFGPSQQAEDYERIKASIRRHKYSGIGGAIYLHEGKVLDGWNRYRACRELKIALPEEAFREWKGQLGTPAEFVIGKNLDRHMYTTPERAMIASALATLGEGRPSKKTTSVDGVSEAEAATRLKVSVPSVQRAKTIKKHGTPGLQQAVKKGKVSLAQGAKIASQPKATQKRMLKRSLLKVKAKRKVKAKTVAAKRERQVKCEYCHKTFTILV